MVERGLGQQAYMLQSGIRPAYQLNTTSCFSAFLLLQRLDVGHNRFAGRFDELLGALSLLVSFSAESNMLSGTLLPIMSSPGLKVSQYLFS